MFYSNWKVYYMSPSKRASPLFFFLNHMSEQIKAKVWCPNMVYKAHEAWRMPTAPLPLIAANLLALAFLLSPSHTSRAHQAFIHSDTSHTHSFCNSSTSSPLPFHSNTESTSSRTSVNLQNKLCTHCLCLSGPHSNFKIIQFHNYQLMCLLVSSLWVATHLYWLS